MLYDYILMVMMACSSGNVTCLYGTINQDKIVIVCVDNLEEKERVIYSNGSSRLIITADTCKRA